MYLNFTNSRSLLTGVLRKTMCGKLISENYSSDATFELPAYKLHNLDGGPATSVTISKEQALQFYKQMQLVRRMENTAAQMYTAKIIRGFCHLYNGQEACCVGIKSVMREKDKVITSYRSHGWTVTMGVAPLAVLAELTGRESGCSRGKGGSMHTYGPNFYGGNGIVGAQVPVGTGIALSCKYRDEGCVCMTIYGDGAANQGQVYESFNMAALWKLPVVYVCENNKYGMGTSVCRASALPEFYARGLGFPGIYVDGMDILAVRSATEFAIEYVLKNGPIIIECSTYRYFGHSMSDPGISYRPREEVQTVRDTRDPINNFRAKILDAGLVNEEELKKIDDDIKQAVEDVAEKAKSDKEIGLEELTADIYANPISPMVRGPTGYNLAHITKGKPLSPK